ncbi:MAG: HD-GYP domain-containing protein [Methylococcales bacterium]|nr:HD-GYP domain-containing protein [Methylococcales bacterium]
MLSTRYSIYRQILTRLLWGWFFLCIVLGAGILWLEMQRVGKLVHQLALTESSVLSGEDAQSFLAGNAQSTAHLSRLAEQLVDKHFLMVELFDRNKDMKLEVMRQGHADAQHLIEAYRRQFPRPDGFSHDLHFMDGQLWMVIVMPLQGVGQIQPIGYFEGVYQVDQATFNDIRRNVLRTLILVGMGISFTILLMYPVVLALIKGGMTLSARLLQGNLELLNVLGCAIAERDSETNSHNYRVCYYALKMGETLGLSGQAQRNLLAGAFLHDVGKIGIRDPILLKPGKLTDEEFEIMKTHVSLGVAIIKKSSWLSGAREVVEFHHEKYDGSGYLQGLKGDAIPLNARIFAIVDVFDALTSARAYKGSWSVSDAISVLENGAGSHFDPKLVRVFAGLAAQLYEFIGELEPNQLEAVMRPIIGPYFLTLPEPEGAAGQP